MTRAAPSERSAEGTEKDSHAGSRDAVASQRVTSTESASPDTAQQAPAAEACGKRGHVGERRREEEEESAPVKTPGTWHAPLEEGSPG